MAKVIREHGAEIAMLFDNASDFVEVNVLEGMLVAATFFWLNADNFDIRKRNETGFNLNHPDFSGGSVF